MSEDMARSLGLDGPGVYELIDAEGKRWVFDAPTQADKAAFKEWCRRRLLAELREWRNLESSAEHQERQLAVMEAFARGEFDWMQPTALRLMQSEDGGAEVLRLCLHHRQPWVTREDIEHLARCEPDLVRAALEVCLALPPSRSRAGNPTTTPTPPP